MRYACVTRHSVCPRSAVDAYRCPKLGYCAYVVAYKLICVISYDAEVSALTDQSNHAQYTTYTYSRTLLACQLYPRFRHVCGLQRLQIASALQQLKVTAVHDTPTMALKLSVLAVVGICVLLAECGPAAVQAKRQLLTPGTCSKCSGHALDIGVV